MNIDTLPGPTRIAPVDIYRLSVGAIKTHGIPISCLAFEIEQNAAVVATSGVEEDVVGTHVHSIASSRAVACLPLVWKI